MIKMKISELIAELEKLKEEHGDLPVFHENYFEIDNVYFEEKEKFEWRQDLPDRIIV